MTRYRHLITADNSKWWTLGAMCFALFMMMLDNTVVNVALPSIQEDLGASLSSLEWAVNAYTLSFGVLLVTGGRFGDIFGRRRMFLLGVTIFALSSATAGLAQDTAMLIVSRVVQGVGGALMMPATLSIVTNAFEPHERGKAIGTWAGVSALALAIGPVVGGLLTEHVSWRAIFYLNIPVAIGAIAATLFAVRESRDESVGREIDYLGVGALTVGLTALVLALIQGNAWGWGSVAIIGLLVLSVVALAAFVVIERRVPAPVVELPLFASRNFVGTNLVALIVTFAMLAQFFFVTLYIQDVLGYSPVETGLRFLPATLMIVADRAARRPADRPDRPALADRGRAHDRLDLAVLADDDRHRHHLRRHLALVRADGDRDGAGDVADVDRRDERGRGREGRGRLGDPLDEPDGRRDARRRRDRRRVRRPGPRRGRGSGRLRARVQLRDVGRDRGHRARRGARDRTAARPRRARTRARARGPGDRAGRVRRR